MEHEGYQTVFDDRQDPAELAISSAYELLQRPVLPLSRLRIAGLDLTMGLTWVQGD